MSEPKRPVLRWHGGKWMLAPWIIEHFGEHRVYCEPFGGAASVLLRKKRSFVEYYGDLDGEVVNLFQVLRSPAAPKLVEQLELTPFAEAEFDAAMEVAEDPVERARRLVIRSFMGFGTDAATGAVTGFRACSNRSGSHPSSDWANYPAALRTIIERLRGVTVRELPAIELMSSIDDSETLHYVDPPYLGETRGRGKADSIKHKYRHELSVDDHAELLDFLRGLSGMVVLSGYPSDMYDAALTGWTRIDRRALADGAGRRTECIWLNEPATAVLAQPGLL